MNRVLAAWRSVGQESLNLPNLITLTRILLIPVFVLLFVTPTPDRSFSWSQHSPIYWTAIWPAVTAK